MTLPARLEHQSIAIARALKQKDLLLGLGTGMGKSRIMAELAYLIGDKRGEGSVLILVPNSTLEEMIGEIVKWLGFWGELQTKKFLGLTRAQKIDALRIHRRSLKRGDRVLAIFLMSHEDLSYLPLVQEIRKIRWGAILLDEASRFRNPSRRSQMLATLHGCADRHLAASGSFITNSPADMWYVCQFTNPRILPFYGRGARELFILHFCLMGGYGGTKPIALRPDREAEWNALLDPWRMQLTLSDIRQMPERSMQVRRVNLSAEQEQAYNELLDTLMFEIEGTDDRTFSVEVDTYVSRMQKLQEIAAGFIRDPETHQVHYFDASAKHDELIELLQDPTPTIVYTWWVPEYIITQSRVTEAGIPWVDLGDRKRFLDGKVNVLLSPMGKGSYGLNLDRARRIIYVSLPWDLDIYGQSQERNWRLTTEENKVIVHLLARGTIDERVREKLLHKTDMALRMTRSQALEMLRRG